MELLVGPSGAYLLMLLGFIGMVLLIVSAARGKFKDILVSFAVCVAGGILGIRTGAEIFVLLSILGFFSMFAFGVRRLVRVKTNMLLIGVLFTGGAVLVFIFRAIMASFFGMG